MRPTRRRLILSALVLLVLAGHLPFLATTLEDLDSFNFALALHDFDPRRHQPHPPGYPVVVVLGRLAEPIVERLWGATGTGADARALALSSAVSGALSVVPLFVLFRRLDALGLRAEDAAGRDARAIAAAVLTIAAPLYWFTAARPLSDMPGLMIALASQALLVGAWISQRPVAADVGRADRLLHWGAVGAAAAIGARSQAVWLVAPILTLALIGRRGPGATRARATAMAVFIVTALAWAIPLVVASGGIDGYINTLADQAGEDFAGVEMVWTTPSARVIAFALRYAFLDVWGPLPLGILVGIAAAAGTTALLLQARTAIMLAGVLWLPYFVFHLLFQETATSRYDLPLVPPMAWLATQGLLLLPRLGYLLVVAGVSGVSLAVTAPALLRYATDGSPVGRVMSELAYAAERPSLAAHHVFVRAFQADGRFGLPLSARRGREWFEVVRRWRDGVDASRGGSPAADPGALWFLGEPHRTDSALVDPVSRKEIRYDWTFDAPPFIRGTRPDAVAWFKVSPRPAWFLTEGWALTPELAGIARRDGVGLEQGPLAAYIRRRSEAATMVVGGRHLGRTSDPAIRFEVRIDDQPVDTWDAAAGPFLRFVNLAAGRLAGEGYARLTIHATPAVGVVPPPAAIEQFDLQSLGTPVWGFDGGWHEGEYDRRSRQLFRWTSGSADLRVANVSRDLELHLTGDSPLKYFDRAPGVVVRAGSRVLAREAPSGMFDWRIRLPADALAASGGVVTIDTDLTFRPADGDGADARELGLRLFDVTVAR